MNEQQNASALADITVIDLTRVLGGPYCTQIFGDHGANIIKVEPPQGDETRDWGPPFQDGDASYYTGVNRNKRSIGLDLSGDRGRDVLLRLLQGADVLIENYKPGTMEKWGLGYEENLKQLFPTLVHCRISGFGSDGPLGGYPGYDAVVQGMVGMFSVNGTEASGPTRMGVPLVDLGTGLYAALGILMALHERTRSGLGQYIDMTLYDAGIALMHPHIPNYYLSGKLPRLTGNAHPNIGLYDKYSTKTGDIFLAIGNDRAFRRLCTELGHPELVDDPRFLGNADRVNNRSELTEVINALLSNVDGEALCERLLEIGVPAGPVLNVEQVMQHPHTKHRGMAVELEGYRGWGDPIKMSRTPGSIRRKPPKFSDHAREVLNEFGFSEDEVQELVANKVLVETRRR
ncbi:MAG: CoA transferase [Gammaproteobacteria bacterium]|nr:CoA transferase [Gammaproteobacteria bacterium]